MKVKLLNDGGFEELRGAAFPLYVEAHEDVGTAGVWVSALELGGCGCDLVQERYYFASHEYAQLPDTTPLYLERLHPDAVLPTRATTHAAGMDVSACLPDGSSVAVYGAWSGHSPEKRVVLLDGLTLMPGERALVPTGWKMCCDPGWCIKFYPRSGLSVKRGLSLVNCVGIVDSDYRGEVCVTLINLDSTAQVIEHGDRLCQLMLERVEPMRVVVKACCQLRTATGQAGLGVRDYEY